MATITLSKRELLLSKITEEGKQAFYSHEDMPKEYKEDTQLAQAWNNGYNLERKDYTSFYGYGGYS